MIQQSHFWEYIWKENIIQKDAGTLMFIAALFTIVKSRKQPKCPSTEEWIMKMWYICIMEYSVQFSCSVLSDTLWPHGPQHSRPPCPSSNLGVYPNSCPLRQWWHSTISFSVVPFSSRLQSFPALGSFKWVSSSHQWPKYWSFSFNISPSNE